MNDLNVLYMSFFYALDVITLVARLYYSLEPYRVYSSINAEDTPSTFVSIKGNLYDIGAHGKTR